MNGDGYSDILVSAYNADPSSVGKVHIYVGGGAVSIWITRYPSRVEPRSGFPWMLPIGASAFAIRCRRNFSQR